MVSCFLYFQRFLTAFATLHRWAWSRLERASDGDVSDNAVKRLIQKYTIFLSKQESIVSLIDKCDKNNDKDLDTSEILELLVVRLPCQHLSNHKKSHRFLCFCRSLLVAKMSRFETQNLFVHGWSRWGMILLTGATTER
jgi:hypothetical protein